MINVLKKLIPKEIKRSIKQMGKQIKIAAKPNPKSYKQVVSSYDKYIYLQTKKYQSHESENEHWAEGQERYIKREFSDIDRHAFILDIACGDGIGMKIFKEMGFKNVIGVELADEKIEKALSFGFLVLKADMHNLKMFNGNQFDVIYSSHTLEHAYNPVMVLKEFYRILKNDGILKIVLPYPDINRENDEAHGGKYELHTNVDDDGKSVIAVFESQGFILLDKKFDTFREPEIWLTLKK